MKPKQKILLVILLPGLAFLMASGLLVVSGLNDQVGNADVALVLGNRVNLDGTPSPRLKARLDTAAEHYALGHFPKIIVSGGTGVEGVPEGTAMRNYLVGLGVPQKAILIDNMGVDTRASVENTIAILNSTQLESVFVVTQYFHIPRTKLALKKSGVSEIYNAYPRFFEGRDFYSIAREVPAFLKYLVVPL